MFLARALGAASNVDKRTVRRNSQPSPFMFVHSQTKNGREVMYIGIGGLVLLIILLILIF